MAFLEVLSLIWQRTIDITKQPFIFQDMLWILLPLLTTLVLMQVYFGRYKKEELGWNSAVANSLVLFFVSFNLLSYLHRNEMLILISTPTDMNLAIIKSFIAIIILLESLLLLFLNFFHVIRGKIAFEISSPLILNYIGIISIIVIYSNIGLGWITLVAAIILFIMLVIFFKIVKLLIPAKYKEKFSPKWKGMSIPKPVKKSLAQGIPGM